MAISEPLPLPNIDPAHMEAVVRRVTGRAGAQLRDWLITRLGGGAGNPVSAGLYRVAGTALDRGQPLTWSVVLKAIQSPANVGWSNMGEGDDMTHWNYWKREVFVYASDLLARLPVGLAAPHCFGNEERLGNTAWLWLEYIQDDLDGKWTLERFALTARHLGRLNGMYTASQPIPAYPWLGVNLIKQWLIVDQEEWRSLPWDDPRVLARYPQGNAFHLMLIEHERFQAALDRLPRTICHGDTYPTNFMSRRLPDGQEETVALDWALVSVSALGEDLGQLVLGAHNNLGGIHRERITETLFESYLAGLHDSGCQVDPRTARFGFTASAALRVGLFQVISLADDIRKGILPLHAAEKSPADPECFEIRMAREAFSLIDAME